MTGQTKRRVVGPSLNTFQACVVVMVMVSAVAASKPPSLVILPTSILKSVGSGAYVSCTAEVDDAELVTEMSWTAPDGTRITGNTEESISTAEDGTTGKLDLVLSNLRHQDVGDYTCSAVYAGNQKLEAKIKVDTFVKINFGDTPKHQSLLIGKEGKIKCTPMAEPAPQVEWFKNTQPLKNDDNRIIQQDGILITNVTKADEGTYRCRALVRDLGSMEQLVIQVEVIIPPLINILPQNITGREHEEAIFECGATGKPAPTYSWVDNNNVPLQNGDNFHVNSETGVLKIMNLRPEQSGEYRCTATNTAGDDVKTGFLQVFTKPKVEEFLNATLPEEADLEMRCVVTGSPAPRVVFKKESLAHNFTSGINVEDDRITVRQETDDQGREVGILQISDLARSDDGLYSCTAVSEGGVTQTWGHVTVEFSPTFEEQGPSVMWTWEKAPVNLTCQATSIPNATIQWYLRNEEIDLNDNNVKRVALGPLGVLQVDPVSSSYFGFYTCRATNTIGSNSIDIELKEAHPPGPVTSAKVEKKTATTITWSLIDPADDGGLPIKGYLVEYRENDHSWENPQTKTWNKESSHTIDGLRPLATYVFRFAARNRVGLGEWGGEKSEIMPGHAEPEEPLIFDASTDTSETKLPYSNHYDLQWQVPLDNGKEIDSFQIVYYQVQKKDGGQWEEVGERTTQVVNFPGTSSYKIEGLQSDSHYKIELRAHNDIGYSTPAETFIKTAPGRDPTAPPTEDGSNTGLIVGVVIVVLLVLAVVIDVSCYFTRGAGLTAAVLGRRGDKDKDKETMLEDGNNASDEKHEGNGQMKTDKEELKPEQQNNEKKAPSDPTETTPMIQGEQQEDKEEIKKEEKEDEKLKTSES